jgi:hypothetical protein
MWRPQQAHIGDLERLTSMGGVKPTPEIGLLTSKKWTHFENNEPRVEKLDRPKLKNWMNQLNHLILGAKWTLNGPPKVGIDHP